MKVLYIGQCEEGSTSRMRFDILQSLLNIEIILINLSLVIFSTSKIFRTLGWRYKRGPLIWKISKLISEKIQEEEYFDLVWIDKGVFISFETFMKIRKISKKIIHYTPDPAFFYHKSRFFLNSLSQYDYCITTKSFEIEYYKKFGCRNIIYCTQGYDELIHSPQNTFENKIYDVCFIGHYEKERAEIIQSLINSDVKVALAGINWFNFVYKNKKRDNLFYFGKHLAGKDYSRILSSSKIGLGLLSKWIPEKHTTRTFEIPACGTYLASERNEDLVSFFDSEVLYFKDSTDLILQIKYLLQNPSILKSKTINQFHKLQNLEVSNRKIITDILTNIGLLYN
jgi:spore maturation protein CgeB